MKKRFLALTLTCVITMAMSGSTVFAADVSGEIDEKIEERLQNQPVHQTMTDGPGTGGNTYTVIGQCFEGGGISMNIAGAETICEVYKYVDNSAAGQAQVNNYYKLVTVKGAGVMVPPLTEMPFPDKSVWDKGKTVIARTQINNAPFHKLSIGAEHEVAVGYNTWYGVSLAQLID